MKVKNIYKRITKLVPGDELCCLPYVIIGNGTKELHAFTCLYEEFEGEYIVFGFGHEYWVEDDEYLHSKPLSPFMDKNEFFHMPLEAKKYFKEHKKDVDEYLDALQELMDADEDGEEELYDKVAVAFDKAVPSWMRAAYNASCPGFVLFFSHITNLFSSTGS